LDIERSTKRLANLIMRYYESPKGNNNKTSEYIDETKEVSES
jgi:hypothetical protein